jgi:hypothetical protein
MEEKLQNIVTNLVGTVRRDYIGDDEYLVAPMIMIVEGVLNGSSGKLFYPADELSAAPDLWNNKPVVVNHPEIQGKPLSACSPDVLSDYQVGQIHNTVYEDRKLKAEAWLRVNRLEKKFPEILNALNEGRMMEVSTGLFAEYEVHNGEHNGRDYKAVVRNIRPDHLAILPNDIGACSIADGAGLLRVNAANLEEVDRVMDNDALLNEALSKDTPVANYKIYEFIADDKRYQQYFRIDNEGAPVMVGKPIKVTTVENTPTENHTKGEEDMEKDEMIKTILSNTAFEESDREFLEGLDAKQLEKMIPVKNEEVEVEPEKEEPKEDVVEEKPTANSVEEYLAQAPAEFARVLRNSYNAYEADRAAKIQKLVDNEKCLFNRDELGGMDVEALDKLLALAESEAKKDAKPVANYAGQAPVVENSAAKVKEPLLAPTINWKED